MNVAFSRIAVVILAAGLSACASAPSDPTDPYEPINRAVFDANNKIDEAVALPVAKAYVKVVPEKARTGIHNVIANLDAPVTFGNDLLQGNIKRAAQTLFRFGVNSTLGLGGLIDVAAEAGQVPAHEEDFGQTLGVYGVPEGPYLVLPFLGPSNPRDLTGNIADFFMDPVYYMRFDGRATGEIVKQAVGVVDLRSRNIDTLDQIRNTAVDYYATTRSLYRQNRNSEIHNGSPPPEDLPDL